MESILLIIIIAIFIIFFGINRGAKGTPLEKITFEAGIGSLLAGTFFGIVREVLLKRPANFRIALIAMIVFFIWYLMTKSLAVVLITGSASSVTGIESSIAKDTSDVINEKKSEASKMKAKQKLPDVYGVFISSIIVLLVVVLVVAFYAQRRDGSEKFIVNFNIMMTFLVVLAGLFTFLSGSRLDYELKIKIASYSTSFALVFCVLAPIFIFKSFSFTSLIITAVTFFIWLTLTHSFANFMTKKTDYIQRI